ncbi:hypothetical protein KI688_007982 [Linnemannia hyalina]|uniref:Crinkler effector protein N-terminal domain-containing protein n=1 Tax=Linnemannia hyalina TaxID=64524 RepID=A0A9P7Y095_9FUNG|nr:hypothetical protein KI688_007982 [Linnemannia hyalina]
MAEDLTLFCLIDGQSIFNAFSVEINPRKTIDGLKKFIRNEKTPRFDDVAADELTLWRVSIPDADDDDDDDGENLPILPDNIPNKDRKKLKATRELSDVFREEPAKRTIHIIVQRPPPAHVLAPARSFTAGLDESPPGSTNNLRVDIKKIKDKFFATGSTHANFLDAECGKTWSMIEMLCLQWGFYFNAAKSDFGSEDLFRLAVLIDDNILDD